MSGADPRQNHLLKALPEDERERIFPKLGHVPMRLGEVLYEPGVEMRYVYFPTTSIVSLLYVMDDGASAEIAIVGNEGIVGGLSVHGRGINDQPGGRAKRGARLPTGWAIP